MLLFVYGSLSIGSQLDDDWPGEGDLDEDWLTLKSVSITL